MKSYNTAFAGGELVNHVTGQRSNVDGSPQKTLPDGVGAAVPVAPVEPKEDASSSKDKASTTKKADTTDTKKADAAADASAKAD